MKIKAGMIAILWVCASCGGEWDTYEPNVQNLPPDEVKSLYPSGPYGIEVGQVVEDISFKTAFFDPQTMCKPPTAWKLEGNGPQKLSLSDLHRGGPLCPSHDKTKLLLVSTTPS